MDKLYWYDYVVVFMIADMSMGIIMAILFGNPSVIVLLPIPVLLWSIYENFRKAMNDKEPD
jgi:hypothetical protein